jgi:mono/diheme cytochrome c family protein
MGIADKPFEDFSVQSTKDLEFNSILVNGTSGYVRNTGSAAIWIVILIVALTSPATWASDKQSIARGRQLYIRYCAACHGNDADGRGPVAEDLKEPHPDLRDLGERYGMPLPIGTIASFIDGRHDVAAHGPRTMPVWGKRLYDTWTTYKPSEENLNKQIREIIDYLSLIQMAPPSARPHSP